MTFRQINALITFITISASLKTIDSLGKISAECHTKYVLVQGCLTTVINELRKIEVSLKGANRDTKIDLRVRYDKLIAESTKRLFFWEIFTVTFSNT